METMILSEINWDAMASYLISPKIASMASTFAVNPAHCSNPEVYRDYLMFEAFDDYKTGRSTTHVLIDQDANRIAGYVSLKTTSFIRELSPSFGDPALEISLLAVDRSYESQGVGSALLNIVLDQAYLIREESAGIQYIVVGADPKAVGFYSRMGFSYAEDDLSWMPHDSSNILCTTLFFKLNNIVEPITVDDDDIIDWPWPFD